MNFFPVPLRFGNSIRNHDLCAKKARNQHIFHPLQWFSDVWVGVRVCVCVCNGFHTTNASHCIFITFPFPYSAYIINIYTMGLIKYLADVFWDQVKALRRLLLRLLFPLLLYTISPFSVSTCNEHPYILFASQQRIVSPIIHNCK